MTLTASDIHTFSSLMKVNFDLHVGELTSRTLGKQLGTLANRPKTLANKTLAKLMTRWRNDRIPN